MVIELQGVSKSYRNRRGRTRAVDDLTCVHPRGRRARVPRAERLGQDDDDPHPARPCEARRRRGARAGLQCPTSCRPWSARWAPWSSRPSLLRIHRPSQPADPGRHQRRRLSPRGRSPGSPVGLTERAEDRARGYSLGMRQRLAIAAAMLKSPRLLILDEPTNGLDPAGMVEVRKLVRRLGSDGRTSVMLSSHLLAEVEAVCDAVTILQRGALVTTGVGGRGALPRILCQPAVRAHHRRRSAAGDRGAGRTGLHRPRPRPRRSPGRLPGRRPGELGPCHRRHLGQRAGRRST